VPDAWTTWFIGCLPPTILGMVVTPILLFKLFPPEVRRCPVTAWLQKCFIHRRPLRCTVVSALVGSGAVDCSQG
jgi:di/tricarboxylate transporter